MRCSIPPHEKQMKKTPKNEAVRFSPLFICVRGVSIPLLSFLNYSSVLGYFVQALVPLGFHRLAERTAAILDFSIRNSGI